MKLSIAEIANRYGSDSPEYADAVIRHSCRMELLRAGALMLGASVVVVLFLLFRWLSS